MADEIIISPQTRQDVADYNAARARTGQPPIPFQQFHDQYFAEFRKTTVVPAMESANNFEKSKLDAQGLVTVEQVHQAEQAKVDAQKEAALVAEAAAIAGVKIDPADVVINPDSKL